MEIYRILLPTAGGMLFTEAEIEDECEITGWTLDRMEDTGCVLTHRGVERQGTYEAHSNHKPKIYRTEQLSKRETE